MVTNCCRFLCYFCRISRQNQRSMFDHLGYLLENSGIGLGETPQTLLGLPPVSPVPPLSLPCHTSLSHLPVTSVPSTLGHLEGCHSVPPVSP